MFHDETNPVSFRTVIGIHHARVVNRREPRSLITDTGELPIRNCPDFTQVHPNPVRYTMAKQKLVVTRQLILDRFAAFDKAAQSYQSSDATFAAFAAASTNLSAEQKSAVTNALVIGKLAANNEAWKHLHFLFNRLAQKVVRQADDQMISEAHFEIIRDITDMVLGFYPDETSSDDAEVEENE